MSAVIRYEPIAYCADCNEGRGWEQDDPNPDEWAEQHNAEYHEGTTE
ncbi:hypothetical protein [Arthrobacter sp. GMC3]|nr:hypothetical protein [Arthrobacter sp. GMC3]